MVKAHRRRSRSSSSDSDDLDDRRKQRKHRRKQASSSPEISRHKSKHYKHRSRSDSPEDIRHRIKQEPDWEGKSSSHRHRDRSHEQPDRVSEREHLNDSRRHRERGSDGSRRPPVHVKQEPNDDFRDQRAERRIHDQQRRQNREKRQHMSEDQRYGRPEQSASSDNTAAKPKEAPNFELSGKLTEDTNTYKGVVIKYNEPPEARKPKKRWRLYPFKNDEAMKPLHMHRQSAFLFGRDRLIADIPVDHPSCSKQHAVFQYRMVPYERDDGRRTHRIAPYIIDLDSANGTFVNNKKIEPQRYYELFEKDVVKFGFSSREYVLLHDRSNTTELDDEES